MNSTKLEILELAEELIRTKGFHAFSYADISKPLEIKNAAIHYHFPSKTDLGMAVLQQTQDDFCQLISLTQNFSPIDKLLAFINIYDKSLAKSRVCIMGALTPYHETLPEEMKLKLTEIASQILNWVIDILEQGKKELDFEFDESSEIKAKMIVTSMLASLLLEKVKQGEIFNDIKAGIINSLHIKR